METDPPAASDQLQEFVEALDAPDRVSVATVFELLSDETRLRIIDALYTAREGQEHGSRSFSELREATGLRDTGQFNYHLNRLRDRFVVRTEEGYALNAAGEAVGRLLSRYSEGETPVSVAASP